MVRTDLKAIRHLSSTLLIFCLVFSSVFTINAQVDIGQDNEGCWHCHGDFYPDKTVDINDLDFDCLNDPENPPPIDYSTLALGYTEIEFKTTRRYRGFNLSENFINSYSQSKKGHLSHLISQPFGLGRLCLDCHDSARYSNWEWDTTDTDGSEAKPHPTDGNIYFKDGNTLNQTTICTQCHGGFYPKESEIASESVRVLEWGDPGSVTCLQCHDDSDEHGGMYASYTTYYCSEFRYKVDCDITAPDPDRISGQNYWSKNGHGVTAQESFPGATLDTGYPNKGAMNNENIPAGLPGYPYIDFYNKRSSAHDLNLDPNDGKKNFCWECHWSNERVFKTICANSSPLGKYNGHVDTEDYSFTDERWWGNLEEYDSTDKDDPYAINEHAPFDTCRSCHPAKYSHYYNYDIRNTNYWNCVLCHDPHGSGDENGNANVFMIRSMVVTCNNCHYSQLECPPCTTTFGFEKCRSWLPSYPAINFFDPLILDIPEPDSLNTADVCEVCHISLELTEIRKALENWPSPGGLADYKHRTGTGHYFNPNQDSCENPDDCKIDYRGTDCTGCHVHDPGPPPDPDDPTVSLDDTKVFNSKAFAPTCRCHGIGRIDIATFTVDGIVPVDSKGKSLFGRGHGTPPPPFPGPDPDRRYNPDPHMAHAGYNFPCHRCHIGPDRPVNPNEDYIFSLDGNTPVGFDAINPEGIYKSDNKTCSNLYCHSNGRREDGYAAPIKWDALEGFCIYGCPVDEYDGHFLYCDKCHHTPPDVTDFHLNLDKDRDCDVCHPHNGIYEGSNGEFYKHVNGEVDVKKVYCDENTPEEEVDKRCLECHDSILKDPPSDFGSDSDKGLKHMANSNCLGCHVAVCSLSDNIEHYNYKGNLPLFAVEGNWGNTGCGACHNESHLTKESDKTAFRNLKASHDNISVDCFVCHHGHYALDNINTSQCIACHIPERDVKVTSGQYLHNVDANKDSREDPEECYEGFNCDDCHSKTHKKGKMTFTEWGGGEEELIEKKCRICHTTIYCDETEISCYLDVETVHTPETKCSNCHNVFIFDEEENIYKIKKRHYRMPINLENLEWAWKDKDKIAINDCGVCHGDEDKDLHEELDTECKTCHYNHTDLDHIQEAECVHCHRSTIRDGIEVGIGDIKVGEEFLHKKEEHEEEYHGFTCTETDTDTNTDAERLCCIDCHSNTHKKGKMTFTEWGGEEGKKIEEKCNTCHSDLYCDWTDEDWVEEGKRVHRPDAKCTDCHNIFIFDEDEKVYKIKKEHYIIDPNKIAPINLDNIEWEWEDMDNIPNNDCGVCHKGEPNPLDPNDPNKRLHDLVTLDCRACHISHSDLDHIREDQCASCHIILGEVMVRGEYIHNKYEGLPCTNVDLLCCINCHSKTHKRGGMMAFTEEDTQDVIEGKCKICHNDEYFETIDVACNVQGEHKTKEKCLNCHNVLIFDEEENIYRFIEDHYNRRPTNLEYMEEALGDQDDREGNDCSVCHENVSTDLHNFKQKCYDCHDNHCELNIGEAECAYCHQSDKDLEQFGGEGFLHNNYTGLTCPPEYDDDCCTYCHSEPHIPGEEMTFTEGETQVEIEGKCKICHNDEDLKTISVSCNGQGYHEARDNCLNCHNVFIFDEEENIYKIKEGHYNMPTNIENMKWAWSSDVGNDCGICHTQPDLHKSVPVSEACENCHVKEKHCEIKNISPGWEGHNTCGTCHADVVISGQDLHSNIPSDVSCFDCHGDAHRSSDSIYLYSDDPDTCKDCHGDSLGINVLCNGREVNGTHSPKAAKDCNACHTGVSGGISEHYLNAGPVNVVKSWQGNNSCGACHIDVSVRGTPIHVALGPNSDCAQCHGNHCDMIYGDTPAKCIACHSPNPTIIDICGPGSITTHYAFDSLGINQAAIQDCLSCHVEPLGGGEANPLQHIDNPNTFVKDGACLGCHSLARVRHGATDPLGCISCHPTHCVTNYARNDACIWCHTENPPIVDICKMGLGITSHLAFDSSAFNQIQITNCIGCHVEPLTGGEANPINHIDNPMTHVNPLACLGCHSVVVPHGGSGLPWAGGVWPNVNCYSCHPTHCISSFCDNQACIWCHTDAPLLQNVCGKPGLTPHTGDCVNCHVVGVPIGGECNPADHMNGLTYVKDGSCFGCHANVTTTHGPGTETCTECHLTPIHINCTLSYCSEPQCKLCHNKPAFEIVSDYGCGTGLHDPPAYKECVRCHPGECNDKNHRLGPNDQGMPTDISGMKLGWKDCGLCHADAQSIHSPGTESCTLCHSGTGTSVHSCLALDYCTETKCKLCHIQDTFPITSDYGCGTGTHAATAYVNCTMCHIGECAAGNHLDTTTDVSNMPLNWNTCGLCHAGAQAAHTNCNQSCAACHTGTSNHSCLELDYCSETECKCCHIQDTFPITSDYGCGTGTHAATAYVNCTMCHIGECAAGNHLDTTTDVSNMPLTWSSCGLCHAGAQASHANCPETCTTCHSGTSPHACLELNYCADQKCRCCHIDVPFHSNTQCDCSTCHSAECDSTEHDITGASTNHPLNTAYYNYNGTSGNKGCNCCHGYPPQCVCVGISNTQDHCLEGADNCNPEIYDCIPCHTLFNGQPSHIVAAYVIPAITASCACHGDAFGAGTSGAHEKHLTTPVMAPVYGPGTGNVIDCQACHSSTASSAEHVVCDGQGALVQFDDNLPMIGETDSYTPGTGSCNIYCHSDGTKDPLGIYTYILGSPPLWDQTAGSISCGNAALGTTAAGIYQCHGYPPETHPGGAGGGAGGAQNCFMCHPTPLLGTAPDNSFHINGAVDITGGGLGGGGGVGGGGGGGIGVGGGITLPVI